ncbi:M56 family metallopeptidase [Saccharopolyspora rosea]|uniref:M56 family metallopeptidase n=1 Tax=Saccharopolyspora rosea TaxID=524884 RepID=A0ABW3FTR5_9PSEU|nr:M56 family metallopeptidase [Saccharopolyspora rosea]
MTALIVALAGYVVVAGACGPRLMRGYRRHSPGAALLLWMALISSWVFSVISAGLAAMAQFSGGLGLAGLLHACARAVLAIISVHDLTDVAASLALFGSLFFVLRLGGVAAAHVRATRRRRNAHRREVCTPGRTRLHDGRRITVVEAAEAAAYCVPGRRSAIVLTTGALRKLGPRETAAVIAHEAAHLRGKHHLCVGTAAVLARAFPFVPLLREAPREIARFVEWAADDRAGRSHGRRSVAVALTVMATNSRRPARVPATAMNATGSEVPERVLRLLRPEPRTRSATCRITAALAVPVLAFTAGAAVLLPAATADPTPLCSGAKAPAERSR